MLTPDVEITDSEKPNCGNSSSHGQHFHSPIGGLTLNCAGVAENPGGASISQADSPGYETAYGKQLRESHEAWEAELAAHACLQRTCACCGVTGLAEHFEPVNGRNWACKQATLCTLRRIADDLGLGLADASPAGLVMQLVRELAQVARDDRAAGGHLADPWGRHQGIVRPHRMLGTRDLARLHAVLTAAAGWLDDSSRADWGQELARAHTDLGCRRCGAMGPREPCRSASGTERRDWHTGRAL